MHLRNKIPVSAMLYPRNEILVFLINLFVIETVGHVVVAATLWTLRFFGMPQFYVYYHTHPAARHWLFTLLLLLAVAVSTARILKKK